MAEEKIFESELSAVNEADYVRVLRNGKSSIISKDKLLGMAKIEEREQSALQNLDSATASAMAEIESSAPELRQEVAQLSSNLNIIAGIPKLKMEQGGISSSDGELTTGANRIRLSNPIIGKGKIKVKDGFRIVSAAAYDNHGNWMPVWTAPIYKTGEFVFNTEYNVKFCFGKNDNTAITPDTDVIDFIVCDSALALKEEVATKKEGGIIINVDTDYPLASGYHTLSSAINAIELPNKKLNPSQLITFVEQNGSAVRKPVIYQCSNASSTPSESFFRNLQNWVKICNVADLERIETTCLSIANDTIDYSNALTIEGKGINYHGNVNESGNLDCTDYLAVSGLKYIITSVIVASGDSEFGIAFYDTEKKYISGIARDVWSKNYKGSKIKKIEIPKNACYVRMSYWKQSIMKYPQPFVCKVYKDIFTETLGQEEINGGTRINSTDGTIISGQASTGCTWFIDCEGVGWIECMALNASTNTNGIAFYDVEKNYISGVSLVNADRDSISIIVPSTAKYFRATYWKYESLDGEPEWKCELHFNGSARPNGKRTYTEGYRYFFPFVNQRQNDYWNESIADESVNPILKQTTGVVVLPPDYKADGKPYPVIMYCHGASHNVSYDNWGVTDKFRQQKDYWASKGYVVFDCNGARNNNGNNYINASGALQFSDAYRICFEYVKRYYNVEDKINVVAGSAGGITGINFCLFYPSMVRCLSLLCAWCSAYDSGWGTSHKTDFIEYLGFSGESVYEEDKTIGYDPYLRIKNIGDTNMLLCFPVAVKGWINDDEPSTSHLGKTFPKFIESIRNAGGISYLCVKHGIDHSGIVSGHDLNIDNEVLDWIRRFSAD